MERTRSWHLFVKDVEASKLISSTNNLLHRKILEQTMIRKKMRLKFKIRVSLLTESKLKANLGRHKIDDTEMDVVRFAMLEPMTQDLDPSAKTTGDVG